MRKADERFGRCKTWKPLRGEEWWLETVWMGEEDDEDDEVESEVTKQSEDDEKEIAGVEETSVDEPSITGIVKQEEKKSEEEADGDKVK